MHRKRAATLMSAVMVGLSLVVISQPAGAIQNGTDIQSAPPWAAYVTTVTKFGPTQTKEINCTGSIVGPDWVLTAAHCVETEDNHHNPTTKPYALSKFRVVLGRDDLSKTWRGGQWTVDKLVVDPNWNPASTGFQNDVALLHLKGALPSTATPLPLAPSGYHLRDGQAVTAYGYGCTSQTYDKAALAKNDYNKYKCASSKYLRSTVHGSYAQESDCSLSVIWCMDRTGTSMIMNGDSGGPWVADVNHPSIVGVTSFNTDPVHDSPTTVNWQKHGAARITDPTIHSWINTTAGLQNGVVGTIYRNPDTTASWLFESDGFMHSIADGGTYLCLTAANHQVVNLDQFSLDELPVAQTTATCSSGPNLLVNGSFEDDSFDPTTYPYGALGLGLDAPLTGWDTNSDGTYPWGLANNNGYNAGPAADGTQWVIVGNYYQGGIWIEQTLNNLTPGATYTVTFSISSEDTTSGLGAILEVSFPSGSYTPTQDFTAPPTNGRQWDTWATNAMNFVANSSSVTLRFNGLAGDGGDPGIDNVSVTP